MTRALPLGAALGALLSWFTQISCASDAAGGAAGFCGRLLSECATEESLCEDILEIDDLGHPGCGDVRDDLFDCADEQSSWACPDGSTLLAGASYESGGRQYTIDNYTMWLPASCDAVGDAWQRCTTCGPNDAQAPTEPPPGSYSLSCYECAMSGSIVECRCDGFNPDRTSIDVCACLGDISNKDGTLCCDEGCQ